jgi:glucose/arabinose dehydrogenase
MAWGSDGTLWTVANERDELGSDLVPDYLTSVREGAFYGWPYSYYGQHVDERPSRRVPTWSRERSHPTTRSARTPPRSAWCRRPARPCRRRS